MAQARTNPWLVLLVLTTGFFMILLDTTIVNVAIPAMSTGLNTTLDQILWVLNAYILVYAVLLITAGRLGDRSEEHTSELQSRLHLVCRLLLEKKKNYARHPPPGAIHQSPRQSNHRPQISPQNPPGPEPLRHPPKQTISLRRHLTPPAPHAAAT